MALEWLIRKTRRKEDAAQRIEWMLTRKTATEAGQPDGTEWRVPSYGDLISLNSSRLILDSVGVSLLSDIAGDLVDLLGTSCAVYEKNGDYALRILSSDWCRFMDQASRRRCDMPDNREAMESGRWHCRESGWNEAALRSIETKEPVDIECRGGIRIFAVPIRAGEETVGSITVGYGDPPRDSAKLKELASDYDVKVKDLLQQAGAYDTRPRFITELARKRVLSSARIIGEIVARKQAERALRQSEEKFRALFDNAMDAIVLHDLEGHTIELNREAYERLGYTREEILKMTPDEIDARAGNLPELIESLRTEGRHLFESVHRRRDGTEIPVEVSVRFFELAGKQLVLGVSRDISERKRAEADLRRSEDKLRSLVETISDWVWEIDQTGVYIYASPRIRDLLGYEPEEVLGKAFFDFMVPGERERVARIFHEAAQQRAPLNGIENMKIHKSGKRVDLETSSVPMIDADGNLLGYCGIDRDITERKRAEAALAESEKRFSLFMEHLPASVFIKDQTGHFIFANRYLEELFGCREFIGKTTEELVPQELAERMIADDRKALTDGPMVVQERITDIRGAAHFFDTYKFPIEIEGSPPLLAGIAVDITDRVNTERELANTKILLQSAFSQTPVPMVLVSAPDGVILNINRASIEILGVEGEVDPAGRYLAEIDPTWQDFDSEGNLVPFSELPLALALQGIKTQNKEMSIQRKDGTRRYDIVSAAPIYDSAGEMIAAFAVFPDITERKRAEEALEKRIVALTQPLDDVEDIAFEDLFNLRDLQRLQDLFANAWGVAALITRPDGTPITEPSNFTYFCSEFIRKNENGWRNCQISDATLGRHNPSGPIIQPCLSAGLWGAGASITVGGRHIASWLIGQVRNEAQSEEQIIEYARRIGSDEAAFREAFLRVPIMPVKKFEQIAHCLFALANQISITAYQNIQQARFIAERKQVEEALRESEARFRHVVESSPLAIGLADQDGRIEYLNPAFIENFGYTTEDVPTLTDWFQLAFRDPAYRQNTLERMQQTLKKVGNESGATYRIEVVMTCKDGSVRTIEIFRTNMGKKTLAVFNDLTERKRMEEEHRRIEVQMREVQKLESLGVLAGGIAHDFNNLLMAILGNADLALLSLSPVSPAYQHVEEITRASQRAAELCRQMLAYSGKGRFVVSRHDISEIVREMGQILEVSVSKKATVRYSLGEGLPPVESDATQIRQVIMNLITNASDALGDTTGIITVTTGVMECDEAYLSESYLDDSLSGGTYVYLEVSDTGCGMDPETRSRIFDPFFTTKFTGRGLGMAAVLGIVRGHKGAIKVYSEPGKGSTFRILLPAVEWEAGERVKTAEESASLLAGGTILLVDDDTFVCDVGSKMLKQLGFRVITAVNGLEGLKVFRTHRDEIACVILDLTMPEMGGEETFRELRKLRSDVRVILSSGYNEQDVTQQFVGRGLAGFIQKPYTVASLRSALKRALG